MSAARPAGYTTAQIILHWVIAALFVFQLVFGEDIVSAYRAYRQGATPTDAAIFDANIHVYVGLTVLVLAAIRLILRFRYGAPPAPAGESNVQKAIAHTAHAVLYLAIFGMPISGAIAWFGGIPEAGEVHELAKPVLIAVVAIHAAGALWQHFVAKTDVLTRMVKPRSDARA